MVEFTGERVVPGEVDVDLWNEHVSRYAFAARFARGKRVVDAGCGAGYGTAELARHAESVIGFDAAPDAIAYARTHYSAPNISFLCASCAAVPLASGSADVIVTFEVIEHIQPWREFLAETRRILAPAGVLLVSTPNREYYVQTRGNSGSNPYHVHEFDFEEFAAELRAIFPHVSLFLQNHVAGIAFQPCIGPDTIELADEDVRAGAPEEAHFFLALCSAEPLRQAPAVVYVPSTANVLRERERHIEMLEAEREQLRTEKQNLVDMFRLQKAELEKSNAWALGLDQELRAARSRILELQQIELETTAWAHRLQSELVECSDLLDRTRAELKNTRDMLAMIRHSRWVKLGRKMNVGPDIPQE